jgi:hypothetical protein
MGEDLEPLAATVPGMPWAKAGQGNPLTTFPAADVFSLREH